jgi:hypothetical protein
VAQMNVFFGHYLSVSRRKNIAMLMKLSATFGKLAQTVGISCAILDILSRC